MLKNSTLYKVQSFIWLLRPSKQKYTFYKQVPLYKNRLIVRRILTSFTRTSYILIWANKRRPILLFNQDT